MKGVYYEWFCHILPYTNAYKARKTWVFIFFCLHKALDHSASAPPKMKDDVTRKQIDYNLEVLLSTSLLQLLIQLILNRIK